MFGVSHYSNIRQKYIVNYKEDNLDFVYKQYAGHEQYYYKHPQSIEEMKIIHCKILIFIEKYFNKYFKPKYYDI